MVNWKVITLVVIVIMLAVLVAQPLFLAPSVSEKVVDSNINYINRYLLQRGVEAKLDKIEDNTMVVQKIIVSVSGQKFTSYVSLDGKYLFVQEPLDITTPPYLPTSERVFSTAIGGGFKEIKDSEVCKEDGKLIVYFFGSSTCPHSAWEKPVLLSVISNKSYISYHESIDSMPGDVFEKYSSGEIPLIVVGCKYYRIGSGELIGETTERKVLERAIFKATGEMT